MNEEQALEKTNRVNLLLDFYEPLLTEKQRTFLKHYYHDDFSLGEIAELFHISRQAVFEHIKRAEQTLQEYELKLQLLEKHERRSAIAAQMRSWLQDNPSMADELKQVLQSMIDQLVQAD